MIQEIRCGLDGRVLITSEGPAEKISQKKFRQIPDEEIKTGMRIGPLDHSKLYVSQSWTDEEKLGTAIEAFTKFAGTLVIPLFTHRLKFQDGTTHRALVVGDCHHRTLVWAVNGSKIEGEIVGTSLPKLWRSSNVIPFSKFRRLFESQILRI